MRITLATGKKRLPSSQSCMYKRRPRTIFTDVSVTQTTHRPHPMHTDLSFPSRCAHKQCLEPSLVLPPLLASPKNHPSKPTSLASQPPCLATSPNFPSPSPAQPPSAPPPHACMHHAPTIIATSALRLHIWAAAKQDKIGQAIQAAHNKRLACAQAACSFLRCLLPFAFSRLCRICRSVFLSCSESVLRGAWALVLDGQTNRRRVGYCRVML
jgi:hypothetical protein